MDRGLRQRSPLDREPEIDHNEHESHLSSPFREQERWDYINQEKRHTYKLINDEKIILPVGSHGPDDEKIILPVGSHGPGRGHATQNDCARTPLHAEDRFHARGHLPFADQGPLGR